MTTNKPDGDDTEITDNLTCVVCSNETRHVSADGGDTWRCELCNGEHNRKVRLDKQDEYDHAEYTRLGELADAIDETTAARGVDLWAVEVVGVTATDWAELTGRDASTVARNVRRAIEQRGATGQSS